MAAHGLRTNEKNKSGGKGHGRALHGVLHLLFLWIYRHKKTSCRTVISVSLCLTIPD